MTSIQKLITVFLVLTLSVWASPCCCQAEWVARSGAELLTRAEAATCGCCKGQKERSKERGCCRLGADRCKMSAAHTQASSELKGQGAVVAWTIPPAEQDCCAVVLVGGEVGRGIELAHSLGRPPGTLLSLRCALTI